MKVSYSTIPILRGTFRNEGALFHYTYIYLLEPLEMKVPYSTFH